MSTLESRFSLTLSSSDEDVWLSLMKTALPSVLLALFAEGLVPLESSTDQPTKLLGALLSRPCSFPSPELHLELQEKIKFPCLPSSLSSPWPAVEKDREIPHLIARLIAAGADPWVEVNGKNTLVHALEADWPEVVKTLLHHPGCPPSTELMSWPSTYSIHGERQPLPWTHLLALRGDGETLAAWLDHPGMDPEQCDDRGRTPLFMALSSASLICLLDRHVSIEPVSKDGLTPAAFWSNLPPSVYARNIAGHLDFFNETLLGRGLSRSGEKDWTALINQWVNDKSPPPRLSLSDIEKMSSHRVKVGTLSLAPLAYFALLKGRLSQKKEQSHFILYMLRSAPKSWFTHQSISGVRDGVLWLTLVNEAAARNPLVIEMVSEVLDKLRSDNARDISPFEFYRAEKAMYHHSMVSKSFLNNHLGSVAEINPASVLAAKKVWPSQACLPAIHFQQNMSDDENLLDWVRVVADALLDPRMRPKVLSGEGLLSYASAWTRWSAHSSSEKALRRLLWRGVGRALQDIHKKKKTDYAEVNMSHPALFELEQMTKFLMTDPLFESSPSWTPLQIDAATALFTDPAALACVQSLQMEQRVPDPRRSHSSRRL